MPITEDQCDDFSGRTAEAVRRAVLPILRDAMNFEAMARAAAAPGDSIVPWDLAAGIMAGVVGAAVEIMWSVCDPGCAKDEPRLPALFAAIADTYLAQLEQPPGSFIKSVEAAERSLSGKRSKMN